MPGISRQGIHSSRDQAQPITLIQNNNCGPVLSWASCSFTKTTRYAAEEDESLHLRVEMSYLKHRLQSLGGLGGQPCVGYQHHTMYPSQLWHWEQVM